jgi:hypothetical protein
MATSIRTRCSRARRGTSRGPSSTSSSRGKILKASRRFYRNVCSLTLINVFNDKAKVKNMRENSTATLILVYTNSQNRSHFATRQFVSGTPLSFLVGWQNRTDFGCSCNRGFTETTCLCMELYLKM